MILQQALLPKALPECPNFSFGGIYQPALREAEIGGDFYDLFSLPDGKIGLLLGDVSGKGLAAATVATMARYMARAYALETASAAGVLTRLIHALCESLDEECLFITAIYAVMDPQTGCLRCANAGHWPALISRGPGCQPLETHGPALGLIPGKKYREEAFQLEMGDEVVLFTDGLVEIGHEDPARELQAVQQLLTEPGHPAPQGLAERLHQEALRRSAGPLRDDVAILCLRCHRAPRPAAAVAANVAVEPWVGRPLRSIALAGGAGVGQHIHSG